jgi:hypothetical protein
LFNEVLSEKQILHFRVIERLLNLYVPSLFFQKNQTSLNNQIKVTDVNTDKGITVPDEFIGKMSLFILAGQSNMSGRGEMPNQPQNIDRRVFVFGNDYKWHHAREPIDTPHNQVDLVSADSGAGYSLATFFANALFEKDTSLIIGFIPCAKGGTSIKKWQRDLSENSLYGSQINLE